MMVLTPAQAKKIEETLREDISNSEAKYAAKEDRNVFSIENPYDYDTENEKYYEISDSVDQLRAVALVDQEESFLSEDYFFDYYVVRFKDENDKFIDIACYYDIRPEIRSNALQILEELYQDAEGVTFREWMEVEAENNPTHFSWIFDDSSIEELPDTHKEAYQEFLDSIED